MKKLIVFVAFLWPLSAHAEKMFDGGLVVLFFWYISLIVSLVVFLVFGTSGWPQKICSLLGFISATMMIWFFYLKTTISYKAWLEALKVLALGVSPILGFSGGFYFGKPKSNSKSEGNLSSANPRELATTVVALIQITAGALITLYGVICVMAVVNNVYFRVWDDLVNTIGTAVVALVACSAGWWLFRRGLRKLQTASAP